MPSKRDRSKVIEITKDEVRNVIAIRLTESEKREFEERAQRAGLRLSDWIR